MDNIVHGDVNDPRALTLVKVGRATNGMCDDFIVAPVYWASFPAPTVPLSDSGAHMAGGRVPVLPLPVPTLAMTEHHHHCMAQHRHLLSSAMCEVG